MNLIVGWRLVMKSFMDWSCLVVSRKITKMSSMNLFPERDCPDKGFSDDFIVMAQEEVNIRWESLGYHGCAGKLEKMPAHE